MKKRLQKLITYGLYRAILVGVIFIIFLSINRHYDYKVISGITNLSLVLFLIGVEFTYPLSEKWKMTRGNLWRDLKYILMDIPAIALANALVGFLAIYYSENHKGYFSDAPVLVSVLLMIIIVGIITTRSESKLRKLL